MRYENAGELRVAVVNCLEMLDGDLKFQIQDVNKENRVWKGIAISTGGNTAVIPVAYVDPYLDSVNNGKMTVLKVAQEMLDTYKKNAMSTNDVSLICRTLTSWNSVKTKISMRLINAEMNKQMVADLVHFNYLDLVCIFVIDIDENYCTKVNKQMLKQWDVDEEVFFKQARDNAIKKGFRDETLEYAMTRVMAEMVEPKLKTEPSPTPQYSDEARVFTNLDRCFGTTALLFPDLFANYANYLRSDLIIVPSSVHEFIVYPACMGAMEVIKEVIDEDEFLSDKNYVYHFKTGMITFYTGK